MVACILILPGVVESQNISFENLVTFERDKNNILNCPDGNIDIIFPWKTFGRENIPGAAHRVSSYSDKTMPVISDEWARSGKYSLKCVSKHDGSTTKARGMFQTVGNDKEGVKRKLTIGTTYWISFSIKNEEARKETPWELYFQLHNNEKPPPGWGRTNNPQIAIERDNDYFYKVVYRYNTDDGKVISNSRRLGIVNNLGYTDFIIQLKISNPIEDGILKIWQRNEGGDLINYLNLEDIRIGYYRKDKNNGPIVAVGIYNGTPGMVGRVVYIDNFIITSAPGIDVEELSNKLENIVSAVTR